MGQIISSVCLCHSVCTDGLSVCPHSHGRISWSIFVKSGTEVATPKSKNEFVGVNIAPPLPLFGPKTPIWGVKWLGAFKPNSQNIKTRILSKPRCNLHRDRNYFIDSEQFCTVIKTTKCHSWLVQTRTPQIQDGRRPKRRSQPSCRPGQVSYLPPLVEKY